MNTLHSTHFASNIDRLNAFLDQFEGGCDADFDDTAECVDYEVAALRLSFDHD
ncbi:MAG TPA: hypothetical protein VHC22_18040 [Pirellulales bacterium]|nr:hypothetical protein [Pirellulales bacterium]